MRLADLGSRAVVRGLGRVRRGVSVWARFGCVVWCGVFVLVVLAVAGCGAVGEW